MLHIENGDLLGRQATGCFLSRRRAARPCWARSCPSITWVARSCPGEVLLPVPIEDGDTLSSLLTERCGHAVAVKTPQRGQRRELLDIARRNAREEVERATDSAERINGTLRQLQTLARAARPAPPDGELRHLPHRRCGSGGGHGGVSGWPPAEA